MRTAKVCLCLALALNTAFMTTPVFAQLPGDQAAPGNDVIVLTSGGMIRGSLVELLPGDHATIQLSTGQSAVVRWSEIHHVERNGSVVATAPAQTPAPMPAPAQPAKPAPPPITGPTVLVHLESPRSVNLYRMADGNIACVSPCDMQLPLNEEYRIGGTGVHQSDDFRLEGQPGQRVIVRVDPGLRGQVFLGATLAGVGLLAGIVGIYTFIVGVAVQNVSNTIDSQSSSSGSNGAVVAGVVLMLAGAGGIVIGGVLAIPNLSTSQTQEAQAKTGAMTLPRISRHEAPPWRELGALDRGAAPMISVPIFSRSF